MTYTPVTKHVKEVKAVLQWFSFKTNVLFLTVFWTPLWMFECDDVVRTGLKAAHWSQGEEGNIINYRSGSYFHPQLVASSMPVIMDICTYRHTYTYRHTLLHTKAAKEAAISSPWFLFVQRGTGNCKCDQFYSTIADISYLCIRKVIIWKKSVNMLNAHLYVLYWAISPSLDFPSVHLGVQTKHSEWTISKDIAIIIQWTLMKHII